MKGLLFALLFSFGFAFFATQNTKVVQIQIAQYLFAGVPLYIVVLGSIFVGILLAVVVNFFTSLSSLLIMRKKESAMNELKKTVVELIKRVHMLELIIEKDGKESEEYQQEVV